MIIYLLIPLFLLNSLNDSHRQNQDPKLNTIDVSHIIIVNKRNKTYKLGSETELQKAFGAAKPKRDTDEISGGYYYTYIYNGLEVFFSQKKWDGTTIKNREYSIVLNGHAYAVGDPVSKLQNQFPVSYKNRYRTERFLLIFITSGKIMTDALVSISYNAQSIITEIGADNGNS